MARRSAASEQDHGEKDGEIVSEGKFKKDLHKREWV